MGGRLRRYIDCETRPIYINNCDSNYRTVKPKETCQSTVPKKDQFVPSIKPDFSVISEEQKKHYSSIRKIEVKAGEKVSINFEGTFRGNKKVTGEGFVLQENFGEHYQKELNLSDVAKIHRVRENGKDTYYIGVYHGFNGKLKLTTSNGCGEISTSDKQPPEKNKNEEINEPGKTDEEKSPEVPVKTPLDNAMDICKDLISANVSVQNTVTSTSDKNLRDRRSGLVNEMNEVQTELMSFISKPKIDPAALEYAAAKLKYSLLKGGLTSDSIDSSVGNLRKLATRLREEEQNEAEGKFIFSFEHQDGTRASNIDYRVVTSEDGINVKPENSNLKLNDKKDNIEGIWGDSAQQRDLLSRMSEAKDWESFDKALKEHIGKNSKDYRGTDQKLIFEYKK